MFAAGSPDIPKSNWESLRLGTMGFHILTNTLPKGMTSRRMRFGVGDPL
jgi:hypothetical protein